MAKVFIVTQGDYFENRICAVFSDKTLAEKYVLAFGDLCGSALSVEEWDLDPFAGQLQQGFKPYLIKMNKQGQMLDLAPQTLPFADADSFCFDIQNNLQLKLFASDQEQAESAANLKRAGLIASGRWPENL
jgi:hypothetical protein